MLPLPFLIAEISANHCGKINLAKKLIRCAKRNGADAVKLQTFTADTMTIKSKKKYFKITNFKTAAIQFTFEILVRAKDNTAFPQYLEFLYRVFYFLLLRKLIIFIPSNRFKFQTQTWPFKVLFLVLLKTSI